ncbi:hypothetical protein SLA2020_241840 [Shorea laevis]
MGFHSVSILALLCLGVVGSCHASMSTELYWKSVFPTTPMPKSLQELLRPDSMLFSSGNLLDILKFFSMEHKSAGAKSVSSLGKNIQVLSTEVEEETETGEFTIGKGVKNMGENNIVYHKMKYPYAVFLCHSIDKTDVYGVPLVGSDGTKVKATVVFHKDTSAWNPRHLAVQFLKVKPGSVPICHFLAKETIVWVPN